MSVLSSFLWFCVTSAYFIPVGKVEYVTTTSCWNYVTSNIKQYQYLDTFLLFKLSTTFVASSYEVKWKPNVGLPFSIFSPFLSKICGRQPLKNLKVYGLPQADHTPSNILKAVFHKFYLVHSLILCPIYTGMISILFNSYFHFT